MEFPQPPSDNETRNIIDKLAQFVARNGPEFEIMTKSKQENNPKFAFLYGGEHFNYYQYKVAAEQALLKQQQPMFMGPQQQQQNPNVNQPPGNIAGLQQWLAANISTVPGGNGSAGPNVANVPIPGTNPPSAPIPGVEHLVAQQNTQREQIRQSEQNLMYYLRQQQTQISTMASQLESNRIKADLEKCDIEVADIDKVLKPIIDSCTKDNISSAKNWILQNATTNAHAAAISQYLLEKVIQPDANFAQKLHIIYLVNDVLHHCARKNAEELKKCLENVVVPMYCNAHSMADITEEQQAKLDKLLRLWEAKANYFDSTLIEKLKKPELSLREYQAGLLQQHAAQLTPYTQHTRQAFQGYQQQHQSFVGHAMQQIQNIDTQIVDLQREQQQREQQQREQLMMQREREQREQQIMRDREREQLMQRERDRDRELMQRDRDMRDRDMRDRDMRDRDMRDRDMREREMFATRERTDGQGHGERAGVDDDGTGERDGVHAAAADGSHVEGSGCEQPTTTSSTTASAFNTELFSLPPPPLIQNQPGTPQPGPNKNGPMVASPAIMPPGIGGLLPDLSKPPPGFPLVPPNIGPGMMGPMDTMEDLTPTIPYFDLPAGLMVPLIKLEDNEFKPLDPADIRLPPPVPPNERLLQAVEAFYMPYSHDCPRDSEGWEKLALYEYYKAKNSARKDKTTMVTNESNNEQPNPLQDKGSTNTASTNNNVNERVRSGSISPILREFAEDQVVPKKRYCSKSPSRSRSKSKSRSRSRSPSLSPPRALNTSNNKFRNNRDSSSSRGRDRDRDRDSRDRRGRYGPRHDSPRRDDREITPPSFGLNMFAKSTTEQIDESNKGHQMLKRMGWGGTGLGTSGQGIEAPISGGQVRDRQDLYKGVGVNLNDPYENFRKHKGAAFITRMKARAEERS
ncbi:calcium homeostasis endoplasmic reticulum protein-like [Ctenocephalides felis]|uniref:calcium homeostasis endoplasmic reticulum protein-like n=1 Tax=Ctenocephalides felis TaxID=7515 RepID=UPI000E6E18AC|nr:calcium homeostasis endoplasmic reticulum protein-like [Ctenocephalides felis]